jgi:hypothetical protein
MNLNDIMQKLAHDVDGRFVDYSNENTIITIPVKRKRFQNITGYLTDREGKKVAEFMSKVCDLRPDIDYKSMLELNQDLFFSKVIIYEGMLRVAAAGLYDHLTEDILRDMILEVAQVADDLEYKLTGLDVH